MTLFTASNVVTDYLNGSITGSTCYLWNLTLNSGSVDTQITYSEYYVKSRVGDQLYDSNVTDWDVQSTTTIGNSIKSAVMDYICFRLAVILSGGTITEGFDYQVGPLRASRSRAYVQFFNSLISKFKDSADHKIAMLTPLAYSGESIMDSTETPDFASDGAPGFY